MTTKKRTRAARKVRLMVGRSCATCRWQHHAGYDPCTRCIRGAADMWGARRSGGPRTGDKFMWHTGEVVTVASVDGAMTRLRFNRDDGPEISVPTGLLSDDKRIEANKASPNSAPNS